MAMVPAETEDGEGGKDLLLVCPLGFWKEPRGGNKRSLPLFTFDLSLVVGRQVRLSSTRIVCVCGVGGGGRFLTHLVNHIQPKAQLSR